MQQARERVLASFSYDADSGEIVRTAKGGGSSVVGAIATQRDANGYLTLTCGGVRYYGHRVAWLFAHGNWPDGQIDHINGNRSDNRLVNLRVVSNRLNSHNRKPFGGRAHIGVSFDARKRKWKAEIMHLGRHKFLGYRATPDEAYKLYLAAKPLIHEGTVV